VGANMVQIPSVPYQTPWSPGHYRAAPTVDQHGAAIRREFSHE
jgi:hypothetical protein